MIRNIHAVHAFVGNNERLGYITFQIGKNIIDLALVCAATEPVERPAKPGGSIGYRKPRNRGKYLYLACFGTRVEISGQNKRVRLSG